MMAVLVERATFLRGCRLAERVLPGRTGATNSAHLLVQADEARCTLHAVGGGVALRLPLPAEIEQPGQALLPARQVLSILRAADVEVLRLESAPGRIRVLGEGAEFDLAAPELDRPAPVEPFPEGSGHRLDAAALARALRRTRFAAGRPTERYRLDGVLWEVEPNLLRLVATDNRRLAVAEIPAETHAARLTPAQGLLPVPALELLARLLEGQEGAAEFSLGPAQACFRVGAATVRARYVAGAYPAWRRGLPGPAQHLVPVAVGPLLSAARQAAAVCDRPGGRLLMRFEPGRVLLESRQAGRGRSRVRRRVPLAGAAVEVALDPRYLVELLAALDPGQTVLLGVSGPGAPVVASDGEGYWHVLMPLRPA